MKLCSIFRWCLLGLMAFGYGHCESPGDLIEYGDTSPQEDSDFCTRIMTGVGPKEYHSISMSLPMSGQDKELYQAFYEANSAYTIKFEMFVRPRHQENDLSGLTSFPPRQPVFGIAATQGAIPPIFFDKNGSSLVTPSYVGGHYTPVGNNPTTQGANCGSFVLSFCDKPVDWIGLIIPALRSYGEDIEVIGMNYRISRDFCILGDGSVKYTGNGTAPPLRKGIEPLSENSERVPIGTGPSVGIAAGSFAILVVMGAIVFYIFRRRCIQNQAPKWLSLNQKVEIQQMPHPVESQV